MTSGQRFTKRHKSAELVAIDLRVGSRVRLRRKMLDLSQEELGALLGLSFQQLQKYELGQNRISASRLYQLARALDVPVDFFFDDTDPVRAPPLTGFSAASLKPLDDDPWHQPETIELIDAYDAIVDSNVRRRLVELAKTFAGSLTRKPRSPAKR